MIHEVCICQCECRELVHVWTSFFFFQAEDGIRDLVRSRGLGDVYKRQVVAIVLLAIALGLPNPQLLGIRNTGLFLASSASSVSYTHLTLPTSDLV